MHEHPTYQVLDKIGEGPLTVVYTAWDNSPLQREVAVKMLKEEYRATTHLRQGFWERIKAMSDIRHERLLPIFATDAERDWIILELADDNVERRIRTEKIPLQEVQSYLAQALEGLSAMHDFRRLHGQVKPSNLLLYSSGRLKLTDPGVLVDGDLQLMPGTEKYLAPELADPRWGNGRPGAQLDLYALAFCTLEMLAGPEFDSYFPGMTAGGVDKANLWWQWHASDEDPRLLIEKLVPKSAKSLKSTLDAMLRKKVSERSPSGEAALQMLGRSVIPEEIREPATSAPSKGSPAPVESQEAREIINRGIPTDKPPELPAEKTRPAAKRETSEQAASQNQESNAANSQKATRKTALTGTTSRKNLSETAKEVWRKHWALVTALTAILTVILMLIVTGPTEPKVTVSIESDPAGATVTIGKRKHKEKTPIKISLKPGTVELAWEMQDYKSGNDKFEIKPPANDSSKKESDNPQVIHLKLVALPIKIPLTVSPKTASVKIDGTAHAADKSGKYELELLPGSHELVVELADFETHTATIDTTAQKKLDIKLVRKPDPETGSGPEKPPVTTPPVAKLPDGLVAIEDSPVHPSLGLPLKVKAAVLTKHLQSGEFPLEFVLINAGDFVFGATDPLEGELPQTHNSISTPYYMATTETTAAQFAAWMKSSKKPPKDDAAAPVDAGNEKSPPADDAKADAQPADSSAANRPAVMVSFADAQDFCLWIAPGVGRLPTEEEWERAGRGTNGRLYPWGSDTPTVEKCRLAFDRDSVSDDKPNGVVGVRDLPSGAAIAPPSETEIYHLLGNVAEWCADLYVLGANESESTPGAAKNHVIRGASFLEPVSERTRLTWRANVDAKGAPDVGFRVLVPITLRATKPTEPTGKPSGNGSSKATDKPHSK